MGLSDRRKNAARLMATALLAAAVSCSSVPHGPFLRNPRHRIVEESMPAHTPSTLLARTERFPIMICCQQLHSMRLRGGKGGREDRKVGAGDAGGGGSRGGVKRGAPGPGEDGDGPAKKEKVASLCQLISKKPSRETPVDRAVKEVGCGRRVAGQRALSCSVGVSSSFGASRPGGSPGANFRSISDRCHPILVAFVWELTQETIKLPLGCLQGGCRLPGRLRLAWRFCFGLGHADHGRDCWWLCVHVLPPGAASCTLSTPEITQGQILSQYPTDATRFWWHS